MISSERLEGEKVVLGEEFWKEIELFIGPPKFLLKHNPQFNIFASWEFEHKIKS